MEGDLEYNNDFRGTYATLIERWMGLDSKPIVGGSFEQLWLLIGVKGASTGPHPLPLWLCGQPDRLKVVWDLGCKTFNP